MLRIRFLMTSVGMLACAAGLLAYLAYLAAIFASPISASAPATVSGIVSDSSGTPIPDVDVEFLFDGTSTVAESSTTDGAGSYSVNVKPAIYDVRVTPPPESQYVQQTLPNQSIQGATTLNIVLVSIDTGVIVDGTVSDGSGNPIADAVVAFRKSGEVIDSDVTDVNGSYSVVVPEDTYDVTLTPDPGSGFLPKSVGGFVVSGNTTLNFTLVTYSGQLLNRAAAPLSAPNTMRLSGSPGSYSQTTGDPADFDIEVLAGQYNLSIGGCFPYSFVADWSIAGTCYTLDAGSRDLSLDATEDLTFENRTLTGTVVDPDSNPVPGVVLAGHFDVSFAGFAGTFDVGITTDAQGEFTLNVFPGSGSITAIPPTGSGLAPFEIGEVLIASDATLGVLMQFSTESVSEAVDPGGTVTTDTEGNGATPADPVETAITSPNAGTVSIAESLVTESPPSGFQFLTQQVAIAAPGAAPEDPLAIAFQLDASRIPAGETEQTIQMFKDGVLVPACTGSPGTASPDPCVSSRLLHGDGDVEITVLTSSASDWNVGFDPDDDDDGCTDVAELQSAPGSETTGGLRDPHSFWDLMSVFTGNPLLRDTTVSIGDISAVVDRFGANDIGPGTFDRDSDPLSTPSKAIGDEREDYHPSYDRGGSDPERNVWNLLPPDGTISVGDIAAAVAQFGHSCL